jgi:hypothetical protein
MNNGQQQIVLDDLGITCDSKFDDSDDSGCRGRASFLEARGSPREELSMTVISWQSTRQQQIDM